MNKDLKKYITQLNLPKKDSHKGQNGKLLLIGGSELFHAASKWSLDVASKIVDMVFYSSVLSNNELLKQAKGEFWNGIVIERENLDDYIKEADCILIGPGMERNQETEDLVNKLLQNYPDKKIVIDAGALQMVSPSLLNKNHIITPHTKEMVNLQQKCGELSVDLDKKQVTILLKGKVDKISWFKDDVANEVGAKKLENNFQNTSEIRSESREVSQEANLQKDNLQKQEVKITGGNEGMTKGGTGDVLAGVVAALYCTNKANISAIVGSYVNKKAGDILYKEVGPFFNSSDLVDQVPKILWDVVLR